MKDENFADGHVEVGTGTEVKELKSKYEFVMAAAKEAERLNEQFRKTGIPLQGKVTVQAVRRVRLGNSRVVYEESPGAAEEQPKESTYFFGS